MNFAVLFSDSGTEGVMVFTANDMEDALRFIRDPKNFYRPDRVSDPIPFSGEIIDLYKLFPRREKEVRQ